MLKKPKFCWSEIKIVNWSDRCSYIDDVPVKLLKTLIRVFNTYSPQAVKFDAKGYEYIIVFDFYETHIIIMDENTKLETITRDLKTTALELINDIRQNIDDWVDFMDYDLTEFERTERKEMLNKLCDTLKEKSRKLPF